jgi:hypothetical protein
MIKPKAKEIKPIENKPNKNLPRNEEDQKSLVPSEKTTKSKRKSNNMAAPNKDKEKP